MRRWPDDDIQARAGWTTGRHIDRLPQPRRPVLPGAPIPLDHITNEDGYFGDFPDHTRRADMHLWRY